MSKCLECSAPARCARALDGTPLETFDLHCSNACSNACAIVAWGRACKLNPLVCVGDLTTKQSDEALATTGFAIPGGDA